MTCVKHPKLKGRMSTQGLQSYRIVFLEKLDFCREGWWSWRHQNQENTRMEHMI